MSAALDVLDSASVGQTVRVITRKNDVTIVNATLDNAIRLLESPGMRRSFGDTVETGSGGSTGRSIRPNRKKLIAAAETTNTEGVNRRSNSGE
jgi:hypothetical protein